MSELLLNIPKNAENLQLPDPELLTFYKDLENRVFWLEEDISEYTLELGRYILRWNKEDKDIPIEERKPIKIIMFSCGGDLDVSNTLIDIITLSKTPVIGINAGRAMSGAAFIFLSCHIKKVLKNGYFLFHQGSGAFSGTYGEIISQITNYQEQIQNLTNFMLSKTNYTEDEIAENLCNEWYVSATEAKEKFDCEIIESIDEFL